MSCHFIYRMEILIPTYSEKKRKKGDPDKK